MCDNASLFCICNFCVERNKINVESLFFQSIKEHLAIVTPNIPKDSSTYRNVVNKLLSDTDLVGKLDRKLIMKKFSKLIYDHPYLTYKEAFDYLFITSIDPIIRLKFDVEYRERFFEPFFVNKIYNTYLTAHICDKLHSMSK